MASKSTKSKYYSEVLEFMNFIADQTDDDESDDDDDESTDDDDDEKFRFCDDYLYGIKTSEIWRTPELDRTKSTYFILPEAPTDYYLIDDYVSAEMIKPMRGDFSKFWLDELSDLHKDRFLLANYMVIYNDQIGAIEDVGGTDAIQIKDLWIDTMSQVTQMIRGFVMEKNKNKFRRGDALSLFVNGHCDEDLLRILRCRLAKYSITKQLETIPYWSKRPRKEIFSYPLGIWIGELVRHVFSGFVNTYFVWASFDAQNLRRYAMELERKGESMIEYLDSDSRLNDRIDFMRKLKLAAPRWSQLDRRMMLDAIESNGKSCRGTYVQILLNEVGVEKFRKLVFGKQHICAHCRRSSYIGENRMLACKLCDTEGIRPRAWYCDRDCQKADWRRHRANKHPSMVVVEKASKKKKRKPRKK